MQAQGDAAAKGGTGAPLERPAFAASLRGLIGEIWQGGRRVGMLWKWDLQGANGAWGAKAQKYQLEPAFAGGDVELRLLVVNKGVTFLELRAEGRLLEPYTVDGLMHEGSIELRGTAIAVA